MNRKSRALVLVCSLGIAAACGSSSPPSGGGPPEDNGGDGGGAGKGGAGGKPRAGGSSGSDHGGSGGSSNAGGGGSGGSSNAGAGGSPGPGEGGAQSSGGSPGQGGDGTSPDASPIGQGDGGSTPPVGGSDGFSHPELVKVPTFPAKTCAVSAGANTAAINAAIAECSKAGGGTVSFAAGSYSVGSIHMLSNVKLALNGATLKNGGGIDAAEAYTTPIQCQDDGHNHWHNALVWGENLTNVAIVGPGTLDGAGLDSNAQKQIAFKSTTGMLFEDFTQTNTGHFAYLLTDCHDITMAKVTMHPSRDGVDLMECTNVNAHDLNITGGPDDAFALKSDCAMGKALPTDNITVRDSTFGSGCTPLQIGSETWGNFQNIAWSNIKVIEGHKSGIGIQMNDGAIIKNMSYDNITLTGVSFPIFINTTSQLRAPLKTPGHAENIHIRNVTASGIVAGNNKSDQDTAIVISGEPGMPHMGIVLEHITITWPGGGADSADPPEGSTLTANPQYNPRFINPIPSYAAFIRHAKGVEFHDVKFSFGAADARPAVLARDVDGLMIDGMTAQKASGPSLKLDTIKNLSIKGSAPLADTTAASVGMMSY
jgi:hypothetical protein